MNVLLTFLMVKNYAHIWKKLIKFVCKLVHFEHDNAENVATQRYIKTNEFYLYQSDKGFVIVTFCGEERYNHQQSFTTASRQGHIVV